MPLQGRRRGASGGSARPARIDWPVVSHPPRRSASPPSPVTRRNPATERPTAGAARRASPPGGRLTELQQAAVAEFLRVSPVSDELGARFAAAGHQLHLVGGSVRDALLSRLGDDLDFTTDARPAEVIDLIDGWADAVWGTGIDFGTVGAAKSGLRLEITTFRSDLYDGDSRNPVVSFGDSLEGDLLRRDFAINAMAVSLPAHEFADPFEGLTQLTAGVLDTPSTPEHSFRDDPLRMLRAARFASQLSFTPAPRVVAAMAAMAGEIDRI